MKNLLFSVFLTAFLATTSFARITSIITFPAGSNTGVQFNDNGVFGSSGTFTYTKADDLLSLSSMTLTYIEVSTVRINGVTYNWPSSDAALSFSALVSDTAGNLSWQTAGGIRAAGADTQVQFRDGVGFGAEAAFTYDKTVDTLTAGILEAGSGTAVDPSQTFSTDDDLGFYRFGSNTLGMTAGAVQVGEFGNGSLHPTFRNTLIASPVMLLWQDSAHAIGRGPGIRFRGQYNAGADDADFASVFGTKESSAETQNGMFAIYTNNGAGLVQAVGVASDQDVTLSADLNVTNNISGVHITVSSGIAQILDISTITTASGREQLHISTNVSFIDDIYVGGTDSQDADVILTTDDSGTFNFLINQNSLNSGNINMQSATQANAWSLDLSNERVDQNVPLYLRGGEELFLTDDGNNFFTAIRSSTTLTYDHTYYLPATTGTANQVLAINDVFDGDHVDLEWQTAVQPGSVILLQDTLQSGATFFVSSGTVVLGGFHLSGDQDNTAIRVDASGTGPFPSTKLIHFFGQNAAEALTEKGYISWENYSNGIVNRVVFFDEEDERVFTINIDDNATNPRGVILNSTGTLRFGDADNSAYVSFKSSDVVASDVDFTLPDSDGSDGQVLQTDGNGDLSFVDQTPAGAATLAVTTGTSTGFDVVTTSPTLVIVFSSDSFSSELTGGATAFVSLLPSAIQPGGNDTEVQFNNSDVFAGSDTFTWNNGTGVLTVNEINIPTDKQMYFGDSNNFGIRWSNSGTRPKIDVGGTDYIELVRASSSVDPYIYLAGGSGDAHFGAQALRIWGFGVDRSKNGSFAISNDFNLNNNQYFNIDLNGIITRPNQSSFLATSTAAPTTNQTGDGTEITAGLATEIYDLNSDYNTGTYTFTAPVTGKYQLNAQITATGLNATHEFIFVRIITSNRDYRLFHEVDSVHTDNETATISVLADMDASDTAFVSWNVSTGDKTVELLGTVYCSFSGSLIN